MPRNCHISQLQKTSLNTAASFSDVMFKVDRIFVSLQNNKNKVIPCNSENTSKELLKVRYCSALISKISLPLTVFPF